MALFMKGIVCTANQQLDRNTVKLVAKDYDVLVLDKDDVKVGRGGRAGWPAAAPCCSVLHLCCAVPALDKDGVKIARGEGGAGLAV
jgi:hypothetical protein